MRSFFLILFLACGPLIFAQQKTTVYRTAGDSTQNYYTALVPSGTSKGLLVILGGFCTPPDEVMRETKLPVTAVTAGYTVILPYLLDECMIVDTADVYETLLESLIRELIKKYSAPMGRFIIGGQSLGGHRAVLYAEQAYRSNGPGFVRPNGVFGVDPPLGGSVARGPVARGLSFGHREG
ncbi:hypothetical protein ACQ86N_20135 [Puia sp. P3]|uniref:hypothetical protein n=1 Tax=Puia sp. P3 TaxID=3423952 RepID=UPI003D66F070